MRAYVANTEPLVRGVTSVLTRRHVVFAISALMLSVFALSYFFINQSLRLDEAQSLWQTSRGPVAILGLVAEDVHVPLYHELLRLWRVFVGDSVESARLLSQLFFLLSIPALYALGAYAYNR